MSGQVHVSIDDGKTCATHESPMGQCPPPKGHDDFEVIAAPYGNIEGRPIVLLSRSEVEYVIDRLAESDEAAIIDLVEVFKSLLSERV